MQARIVAQVLRDLRLLDSLSNLQIVTFQGTASKFTRAESESSSSVTFSNSGSTPNGSPLGSETEEEANEEELAK